MTNTGVFLVFLCVVAGGPPSPVGQLEDYLVMPEHLETVWRQTQFSTWERNLISSPQQSRLDYPANPINWT